MAYKINKKGAKINTLLDKMDRLEPKATRSSDGFMSASDKEKLEDLPSSKNLIGILAEKQDVITDLSAIRSGAEAGASAYQKPGTGIPASDLSSEVQDMIENGGKTKSVSVNGGTPVTPDENGQVDLTVPSKTSDLENDSDFATKQEAQQMVDDAKIDTVSVDYQEDGGAPDASASFEDGELAFSLKNMKMKFSDLTAADKAEIKGEKGDQGDSAVYDPSSPDAPDFVMANTTGQSTTKAMTQKAVTENLDDIKDVADYVYGDITQTISVERGNIYEGNNYWYTVKTGVSSDPTNGSGRDLDMHYAKGKIVEITPQSGKSAYFAFITKHGTTGSAVSYVPNSGGFHTITEKTRVVVPNVEGDVFMWVRVIKQGVDVNPSAIRTLHDFHDDLERMKSDISDLQEENVIELTSYNSTAINAWTQCWWLNPNGAYVSSTAKGRTLPISSYRGKTLSITARSGVATVYALLKSVPTSTSNPPDYCNGTGRTSISGGATVNVVVPDDANYLYVEYQASASSYTYPQKVTFSGTVQSTIEDINADVKKTTSIPAIHVNAVSGSDSNDGLTAATAVATFSKALSMQGVDARLILHGTFHSMLSISGKRRVVVSNAPGEKAVINRGLIIDDAALDSSTGIYSYDMTDDAAATFDKGQSLDGYWIYQDGISDETTLIPDAERHPLHRGKTYRCDSTKMTRYTSMEGLQGDTSGVPAYYYDTTNKVLYFKIATGSDLASNPVVIPKYNAQGIYAGYCEVHVTGVDCRYSYIFLNQCDNSTLTDCSAKYVCGGQNNFCGGIVWLSSRNVTFTRCEAARCTAALNGATGDGFNAHILETEDSRDVRRMTATLVDCWAHDCIDDGYSDHGRSETTVIGGVFEYNDCGIANATGACDTIYNAVLRRHVTCGIRIGGTVSSETNVGKGTCVTAYGCLAENNGDSGYRSGISSTDGTTNLPNVLTCYNCISVSNNRGFYASNSTSCKMYLYNCSDSGSTTPVTNATTAINATPITS